MDTPTASSAPVASAAPAAAAAPVSTPSAAPVAASTPAPVTPAAPVVAPATGTPVTRESMKQRMVDALEAANAAEEAKTASSTPKATTEIEQPVVQDGATVTEDTPQPTTEEQQGGVAGEGDDFSLELPGPLPPSELQGKMKEIPELAAILDQHPDLKNSLFAASRLAQRTAQYDQQFPGGIEEAQIAAEGNKTFSNISNLFTAVKDKQSTQAVFGEMMKLSYVLDDDGNPVMGSNGQPRTDGSVGKFIEQTFGMGLDHWVQTAQQNGDDELAVALDVVKERAFKSRSSSAQDELTEEQRATQQHLDQQRETLTQQQQSIEAEKRTAFEGKADTAYYKHMDSLLDRVMSKFGGSDEDKAATRTKIKDKVDATINANQGFQAAQDLIWRRQGFGDKKLKDLTALGSRFLNEVLPGIAREVSAENGGSLISAQTEKTARLDARTQSSSKEPQAAVRHAAPTTMNTEQLHSKFREDFVAKNKRQPSVQETLQGVRQLRASGVRTA